MIQTNSRRQYKNTHIASFFVFKTISLCLLVLAKNGKHRVKTKYDMKKRRRRRKLFERNTYTCIQRGRERDRERERGGDSSLYVSRHHRLLSFSLANIFHLVFFLFYFCIDSLVKRGKKRKTLSNQNIKQRHIVLSYCNIFATIPLRLVYKNVQTGTK